MVLSPFLISILALHLPKLCEYLTRFELYKCNEMSFRVQTLTEYSARIALDRTAITLKLPKLEYMLLSLTMLANQLARYKLPEANVSMHCRVPREQRPSFLTQNRLVTMCSMMYSLKTSTETCNRVCVCVRPIIYNILKNHLCARKTSDSVYVCAPSPYNFKEIFLYI